MTRRKPSFLNELGDYFLEHQSDSPYIACCDFFLFLRLKKNPVGRKYTYRLKISAAKFDLLRGVPKKDYEKTFKDRIEICISVKEEYLRRFEINKNTIPHLVVI